MDQKENNSGDEEQQSPVFEVIVKGLSFDATEQDVANYFKDVCKIASINLIENKKDPNKNNKGYCFLKFNDEENFKLALDKDGDEFMGRQLKIEEGKKKDVKDEDSLAIFAGNLSWNVDNQMFRDEFKSCGEIESARVITDPSNGKSKGFGIIYFKTQQGVQAALEKNGQEFEGREMRIKISLNGPRPLSGGRGGRRGGFGGRGRGGFDRGGGQNFRGDRGGNFRGGERGSFRGGGEGRGGSFRGDRGGYGGDRGGGFRGSDRGGFRGEGGRGGGYRGSDRGGFRGDRGGEFRGGDRGGRRGDGPPRRGGRGDKRGGYGGDDSDN